MSSYQVCMQSDILLEEYVTRRGRLYFRAVNVAFNLQMPLSFTEPGQEYYSLLGVIRRRTLFISAVDLALMLGHPNGWAQSISQYCLSNVVRVYDTRLFRDDPVIQYEALLNHFSYGEALTSPLETRLYDFLERGHVKEGRPVQGVLQLYECPEVEGQLFAGWIKSHD